MVVISDPTRYQLDHGDTHYVLVEVPPQYYKMYNVTLLTIGHLKQINNTNNNRILYSYIIEPRCSKKLYIEK